MAVFNPTDIARQIVNNKKDRPSLVPLMPTAPDIPDRPVYTAPDKHEFSWDVPVADRPRGTEDWVWSKSRWAKQDFDTEQARREQEAQQKHALDLGAWQDAVNMLQNQYERDMTAVKDYYAQQGLIAPIAGDPTPVIRQAGLQWQEANKAGDRAAMDYWHNVAERARIDAGWGSGGSSGSLTAGYMTTAGLPTWNREFQETSYSDAMKQQEFENQLALEELGIRRATAAKNSAASTMANDPFRNVEMLVATGADYNTIMKYIESPENFADYKKSGVTVEQMKEYANSRYNDLWRYVMEVSAPPKGAAPADVSRGFRQMEAASFNLSKIRDAGQRFTEADYRKFAADTGKAVEEIRDMDRLGWLDGFMKSFYGQEYKGAAGEDEVAKIMKEAGIPYPIP